MTWISIKEQGVPKQPCACWIISVNNGCRHVQRAFFIPWLDNRFVLTWGDSMQIEVTHYIVEPSLPEVEE